ncbi:hypothetical protein RCL_jg17499.t1 [Rhizophagus clarus]|uniref:Uncharacterized protein n=1 Tax=Rhizophagus clarus TaxID=94130 RepID=A0A8H3KYD8_9GLOM|nr:hypothetical protein RCL_jg17499.t1 [Rhizophagus clarus]
MNHESQESSWDFQYYHKLKKKKIINNQYFYEILFLIRKKNTIKIKNATNSQSTPKCPPPPNESTESDTYPVYSTGDGPLPYDCKP